MTSSAWIAEVIANAAPAVPLVTAVAGLFKHCGSPILARHTSLCAVQSAAILRGVTILPSATCVRHASHAMISLTVMNSGDSCCIFSPVLGGGSCVNQPLSRSAPRTESCEERCEPLPLIVDEVNAIRGSPSRAQTFQFFYPLFQLVRPVQLPPVLGGFTPGLAVLV